MKVPSQAPGAVYFCFADAAGFSGQKAATELVRRGLEQRGWNCRPLPQPVWDRGHGGELGLGHYAWNLLRAWLRALRLLAARGGRLSVNFGQTRAAFLRDSIPLLAGRLGLGRDQVILSLHGSMFMRWDKRSLDARLFCFLVSQAGTVTILGEQQRARLLDLGVPARRLKVLINSCDLPPLSPAEVAAKHPGTAASGEVVRCLFLSSLIDTKGFPEFLEALAGLAADPGPRIEAVLCGRLVGSEFSARFPDLAAAEAWIEHQVAAINRSQTVRVRWIKGAMGAEKAALFHAATIFLLPTRYAVEAQPLVLLEAMASGCAIITSRIGEIPTILDDRSAVMLAASSREAVLAALRQLVADPAARRSLAEAAHTRFCAQYTVERHLDAWEELLGWRGAASKELR